jgi:hypothetical protein
MYVFERIKAVGVLDVINIASDASEKIVRDEVITDPLMAAVVNDCLATLEAPRYETWSSIGKDSIATILQILRYPKRFSPLKADKVAKSSIDAFKRQEREHKLNVRRNTFWQPNHPIYRVAAKMHDLFPWDEICQEIERVMAQPWSYSFTPGVARDAQRPLASKLERMAAAAPEYFPTVFGRPVIGSVEPEEEAWYDRGGDPKRPWTYGQPEYDYKRIVKVAAVPKSYKAARIIAMEDVVRQAKAKAVDRVLDGYMPDNIKIHDQSQNAEMALLGSIDGEVSTVDMHGASDGISKTVFEVLFPPRFKRLVRPLLGTHTSIDDKIRRMEMMSTSGNSLTFRLESLVFYATLIAGQEWQDELDDTVAPSEYAGYPLPSVYGDDQIVSTRYFDVCVYFLEALGFVVNESKSYTGNCLFRESCGTDAYCGIDVSTTYFPRRPLRGAMNATSIKLVPERAYVDVFAETMEDTLVSLISLQHRLYGTCRQAALFLGAIVEELMPSMTNSSPEENKSDLYHPIGNPVKRWRPGAREVVAKKFGREWDSHVEEIYGYHAHMTPVASYPDTKDTPRERYRSLLYDLYRYQEFLKNGPSYEDEFLRYLGISKRPLEYKEVAGLPTIKWVLTE